MINIAKIILTEKTLNDIKKIIKENINNINSLNDIEDLSKNKYIEIEIYKVILYLLKNYKKEGLKFYQVEKLLKMSSDKERFKIRDKEKVKKIKNDIKNYFNK